MKGIQEKVEYIRNNDPKAVTFLKKIFKFSEIYS